MNNLVEIDKLDFRNNKKQLLISYTIRGLGVILFSFVFYKIINITSSEPQQFKDLITVKIQNLNTFLNIALLILNVILILYIHELIHAFLFYISYGQIPKIGMRGFVIFASAPDKNISKLHLIINAIAPFISISILALITINLLPLNYRSWIFIPLIVNAAASGGDFMTIYWALKQPNNTIFKDNGDIITALLKKK